MIEVDLEDVDQFEAVEDGPRQVAEEEDEDDREEDSEIKICLGKALSHQRGCRSGQFRFHREIGSLLQNPRTTAASVNEP